MRLQAPAAACSWQVLPRARAQVMQPIQHPRTGTVMPAVQLNMHIAPAARSAGMLTRRLHPDVQILEILHRLPQGHELLKPHAANIHDICMQVITQVSHAGAAAQGCSVHAAWAGAACCCCF